MLFFLLTAILVGLTSHGVTVKAENTFRAPFYDRYGPQKIPNVYFVMFDRGHTITDHWRAIGKDFSSSVGFHHWKYFFAYTAKLNTTGLDYVRRDRNVSFVETAYRMDLKLHDSAAAANLSEPLSDPLATANSTDLNDDSAPLLRRGDGEPDYQDSTTDRWQEQIRPFYGTPWNLKVISAEGRLSWDEQGLWNPHFIQNGGKGVDVYVLDSGINVYHRSFDGRATNLKRLQMWDPASWVENLVPLYDTVNHGTRIASIVGGDSYGIATGANLINIPITWKQEVAGLQPHRWQEFPVINALHIVVASHISQCRQHPRDDPSFRGSIVAISSGFDLEMVSSDGKTPYYTESQRTALEDIIALVRSYGIEVIASAGNQGRALKPSTRWPCTMPGVICVGSMDYEYRVLYDSNLLDRSAFDADSTGGPQFYLAPGDFIKAASFAGGQQTTTGSGTSFAAPHVAGVAATYMSYMGLAAGGVKHGGVNKYLAINSLHGICRSLDADRPLAPQDNRLVNTGLFNPRRMKGAPFLGAPTKPVKLRQECPNIPKEDEIPEEDQTPEEDEIPKEDEIPEEDERS